ncbi:hypothetical protein ACOMHN_049511 [Nucella lapillus]
MRTPLGVCRRWRKSFPWCESLQQQQQQQQPLQEYRAEKAQPPDISIIRGEEEEVMATPPPPDTGGGERPRIYMSNKTHKVVVVFPNGDVVEGKV